jgi:hypothetical protein
MLISFDIDKNKFPLLINYNENELNLLLLKIFETGYNIHFPSIDNIKKETHHKELIEILETIKINNNSELNEKINSLEIILNKLIGLSSNSNKKGLFGENLLEEIFNQRYGDIRYEKKGTIAHSGDAWLYLTDNKIIMIESKNYTVTINKDEINKFKSDMINHNIKWGILVSFNSSIQGMKELDLLTFTHNSEVFTILMISNLSTDIHKLDLGLQILRQLIILLDNNKKFPWIIKNINNNLNELDILINKNYILRDNFYNMEKEINKSLTNHYTILRDYQYDIEQKIKEIILNIESTMKNSINTFIDINNDILNKYKDKKIFILVSKLLDIIKKKKWIIKNDSTDKYIIIDTLENIIANIKIQQKKIIFNNNLNNNSINLLLGKDNLNELNIIDSLK